MYVNVVAVLVQHWASIIYGIWVTTSSMQYVINTNVS